MNPDQFRELVWQKGRELYRDMPWRQDTRPYYILVSELMLQQTQVDRVIPKFESFIKIFPDEKTLASASLGDVLRQWNGLGYNRRAKFLHDAAKQITTLGKFPDNTNDLLSLPGVGKNTAGAIMAYAHNQPSLFIETNIRTVYIHHFFENVDKVDDSQIMEKLVETVDVEHPREFFWALMDYGTWLKKESAVSVNRSSHYKKQSPLAGSVREIRGQIVRELGKNDMSETKLRQKIAADKRFEPALDGLIRDGLVAQTKTKLHLTK